MSGPLLALLDMAAILGAVGMIAALIKFVEWRLR